jgi:hypothetical protein
VGILRNSILETIMRQLDGEPMTRLCQLAGTDEEQARQGLAAAIPLLIGALERNTANSGGAEDLKRALQLDHDGSILDNIGEYLKRPELANGAGILNHILGKRRGIVETELTRQTGLRPGSLSNLLELAAPLVMGALGRQQRDSGLGSGMLSTHLAAQHRASQSAGAMVSMVRDLLEDDDSSSLDDITGQAGKLPAG